MSNWTAGVGGNGKLASQGMATYLHYLYLEKDSNHTYKPGQKATSDDGDYDPSYKNLELEKRWAALFVPHQEHRLDETLLRALEKRSLKSADISKAARSMTIAKNSREFKALDFGDSINYVLTYTMMKGTSNALVLYNEAMKWEAETIQYCRSQEQSN
ncbi:hypothetical protein IV203_029431 [Nitzschia inconspicua]|uniref:Uncharacterized protein n=1 Tax=Nitzschia inconspicua TaxID=303405 RepID=A0A9K3Q0Y0_9STRA|nr:hypothetical protein IV203_029431 [Nitzschia inconspicua]